MVHFQRSNYTTNKINCFCLSYIIYEAHQSDWKYPQTNNNLLDRPATTLHRKIIRLNQKKRGPHSASLHALLQRSLFGSGRPSRVFVRPKRKGVHRPNGRHLLHEHRPLASQNYQNIPNLKIETFEYILALHAPLPRRIRLETVQIIGKRPRYGVFLQLRQRVQ